MLILLSSFNLLPAQGENVFHEADSLTALLRTIEDDSAKIDVMIALGNSYRHMDIPDSATKYLVAVRELSQRYKCEPCYYKATYYYAGIVEAHGDRKISRKLLRETANYYNKVNDTKYLSMSLVDLSVNYCNDQLMDSAFVPLYAAIRIGKAGNNEGILLFAYRTLAWLKGSFGRFEESLKYLEIALGYSRKLENQFEEGFILTLMGMQYNKLGQEEKAISILIEALELEKRVGDYQAAAISLIELGTISLAHGNRDDAKKRFLEAQEFTNITQAIVEQQSSSQYLGDIYLAEGNVAQALKYYQRSADLARKMGNAEIMAKNFQSLSVAFQKMGNTVSALDYSLKATALKDSLSEASLDQRLEDAEARYNLRDKEFDIAMLEKQKELQALDLEAARRRNLIFGLIAAFLVLMLLTILYFVLQLRKAKRSLEAAQVELKDLNATKDRFFAIIAHDLRGHTTSFQGLGAIIKRYLQRDKPEKIVELTEKLDRAADQLNQLLDNLLNWSFTQLKRIPHNPQNIRICPIVEEVVDQHREIAQGKGIDIEIDINQDFTSWADPDAVYLVTRNLVSNAVKFSHQGSVIRIAGQRVNGALRIAVQDQGVGMEPAQLENLLKLDQRKNSEGTAGEKGSGLGLTLVQEFLKLNHGTLKASSKPGEGSEFAFTLPVSGK
ncbi:MAG: tetratricopeptide repeat protein [Bacteroidia bacterium]|nr:tetratricopeptide repeat protein [Bacteroidia bacterium]